MTSSNEKPRPHPATLPRIDPKDDGRALPSEVRRDLESPEGPPAEQLWMPGFEPAHDAERFFTLPETARILVVSERTVYRKLAAGVIRKASLGARTIRISALELRRIAAGETLAPGPEKSGI